MAARTRKNRSRKAGRKNSKNTQKSNGGESWPRAVKRVYNEMKAKNKNYQFKDAMKEASRRKNAGTL